MIKTLIPIFLLSSFFSSFAFSDDYAGSRNSSGEVLRKGNEYAGLWSGQIPYSCAQWEVSGEVKFKVSEDKGVEYIEGLIGNYDFSGQRRSGVIKGNILSQKMYPITINLKHKFLKIYGRRNVHAEEGKQPCRAQLVRNISLEENINNKLKTLDALYESQHINDQEYSKKRLEITKLLKAIKSQNFSIQDRLEELRLLEEKGLITAKEAANKRAIILDDL